MSAHRGRRDSYPLLRFAGVAGALTVAGLALDAAALCVRAVLRAVGLL